MKLYLKCLSLGFLGFSLFNLSSCVDISGAHLSPEKKIFTYKKANLRLKSHTPKTQGEVHTMLGGLGVFSVGMEWLREDIAKQYPQVSAYSNMWYNAGDVSKTIITYYNSHPKHRPIILMGHSLGANDQIKVARNLNAAGVPVDLLVTVDAVSQTIVPPNVKQVLNIYKPGYVPMFSGLKLKAVNPKTTAIENINVDEFHTIHVNHFTIDKDRAVQKLILARVDKVLSNGQKSRGY